MDIFISQNRRIEIELKLSFLRYEIYGSESAIISVKTGLCHGTITTVQKSLNDSDLFNRRVDFIFYFNGPHLP
jgi:hypothetical protein